MTLDTLAFTLVTILVFMLSPIQVGANSTLAGYLGHPSHAAITNTAVATLWIAVMMLVFRVPLPQFNGVGAAPWWAWVGGLIGGTLVFSAIVISPRVGATAYLAAGVSGTMIAALLIDHFGVLGFRPQAVSSQRIMGALMVVGGVFLVQWKGNA